MFWSLLFIVFVFLVQKVDSQPTTRIKIEKKFQISNFKIYKDRKLISGSSLKNTSVHQIVDCMMECTANSQCVSSNVNTTRNSQGLFDCTLFGDMDKYRNDTELIPTNGVDHYSLPVSSNYYND